jgi:hypothetical protein
MLFFLTGERHVLRLLPLLLGIFAGVYLYDFVFIRDVLLVELIACFLFSTEAFVVLSGWCGITTCSRKYQSYTCINDYNKYSLLSITWACQGVDALTFVSY